jgi:hypothetical protein
MIYVIRSVADGLNFGYVRTRNEAECICTEFPTMFKWEALTDLGSDAPMSVSHE